MAYRFASVFCARPAGVPFEVLDDLGTPAASELARRVLAVEAALGHTAAQALGVLATLGLPRAPRNRVRNTIESRRPLPAELAADARFADYARGLAERAGAHAALVDRLDAEHARARARLWVHAHAQLPDFLVIESDSAYQELRRYPDGANVRRRKERSTELLLARYLQRVCAKNDTISRFGPTTWGRIDDAARGFALVPAREPLRRVATVERWVIRAVVAAIDADPDARWELCPRPHPSGRLEGSVFVRLDTGVEHALDANARALLTRCDGLTPAYALGTGVEALARTGVVIWELGMLAWDRDPLATLAGDLDRWRPGAAKQRWSERVRELVGLVERFAVELAPEPRRALMTRAHAVVAEIGGSAPTGGTLYQATNPIVEHCYRDHEVVVGRRALEGVLADIAPWLDLFADTCALASVRCYERLRELHATAPRRGGEVSLAAFAAHCDRNGVSLRDAGLATIARTAFADAKHDFRAVLAGRDDAPEWELSAADCHVLRDKYALPPVDNGWACPDFQLAAASPEAAARGEGTWIVAELHGVTAPLQHVLERWCPDRAALADAYRDIGPWLVPSRAGFVAPVHVALESMFQAIPNGVFCAPERSRSQWRCVAPAETAIVVDDDRRDVRVHARGGEDLGSLVRTPWMILGGIHPFFPLEIAPHTPRLRLGSVIVQRRTWRVAHHELGEPAPDGDVTCAVVVAVERLRAARDLPRWVYVRPAGATLERTALGRRDRDVKPMYIDLESTVFLEIFLRYLAKYGELDLVEMLPTPAQLCWREPDGRYSFELRMACPPYCEL